MVRKALITGLGGQDAFYLAHLLTKLEYKVFGQTRSRDGLADELYQLPLTILDFDLTSLIAWSNLISRYEFDEIYHLAGQSVVTESWATPQETFDANLFVVLQLLEAIKGSRKKPKLFFASSSEVFGRPDTPTQNEQTPIRPQNPYGVSKAASMSLIDCYRSRYDLFACTGILFNHESPRRPTSFVTRKITRTVAEIRLGLTDKLLLGCMDVHRDWGYAGDFVDCMQRTLSHTKPDDYVIGTGIRTSLRQLVEVAFEHVGLSWQDYVQVDSRFQRPKEEKSLMADPTKARTELGWLAKTKITDLIKQMVEADLAELQSGAVRLRNAG